MSSGETSGSETGSISDTAELVERSGKKKCPCFLGTLFLIGLGGILAFGVLEFMSLMLEDSEWTGGTCTIKSVSTRTVSCKDSGNSTWTGFGKTFGVEVDSLLTSLKLPASNCMRESIAKSQEFWTWERGHTVPCYYNATGYITLEAPLPYGTTLLSLVVSFAGILCVLTFLILYYCTSRMPPMLNMVVMGMDGPQMHMDPASKYDPVTKPGQDQFSFGEAVAGMPFEGSVVAPAPGPDDEEWSVGKILNLEEQTGPQRMRINPLARGAGANMNESGCILAPLGQRIQMDAEQGNLNLSVRLTSSMRLPKSPLDTEEALVNFSSASDEAAKRRLGKSTSSNEGSDTSSPFAESFVLGMESTTNMRELIDTRKLADEPEDEEFSIFAKKRPVRGKDKNETKGKMVEALSPKTPKRAESSLSAAKMTRRGSGLSLLGDQPLQMDDVDLNTSQRQLKPSKDSEATLVRSPSARTNRSAASLSPTYKFPATKPETADDAAKSDDEQSLARKESSRREVRRGSGTGLAPKDSIRSSKEVRRGSGTGLTPKDSIRSSKMGSSADLKGRRRGSGLSLLGDSATSFKMEDMLQAKQSTKNLDPAAALEESLGHSPSGRGLSRAPSFSNFGGPKSDASLRSTRSEARLADSKSQSTRSASRSRQGDHSPSGRHDKRSSDAENSRRESKRDSDEERRRESKRDSDEERRRDGKRPSDESRDHSPSRSKKSNMDRDHSPSRKHVKKSQAEGVRDHSPSRKHVKKPAAEGERDAQSSSRKSVKKPTPEGEGVASPSKRSTRSEARLEPGKGAEGQQDTPTDKKKRPQRSQSRPDGERGEKKERPKAENPLAATSSRNPLEGKLQDDDNKKRAQRSQSRPDGERGGKLQDDDKKKHPQRSQSRPDGERGEKKERSSDPSKSSSGNRPKGSDPASDSFLGKPSAEDRPRSRSQKALEPSRDGSKPSSGDRPRSERSRSSDPRRDTSKPSFEERPSSSQQPRSKASAEERPKSSQAYSPSRSSKASAEGSSSHRPRNIDAPTDHKVMDAAWGSPKASGSQLELGWELSPPKRPMSGRRASADARALAPSQEGEKVFAASKEMPRHGRRGSALAIVDDDLDLKSVSSVGTLKSKRSTRKP